MVIGNGLLANAFSSYLNSESTIIFASGVSNSLETNEDNYLRELELLKKIQTKIKGDENFVYFSTTKVLEDVDKPSVYVEYKKSIEKYIVENIKSYIIVRLPNVIGDGGNKNTLVNFMHSNLLNDKLIHVWASATRNLIDVVDVYKVVNYVITHDLFCNNLINITTHPIKIISIVSILEEITCKTATTVMLDKGKDAVSDDVLDHVYKELGLTFNYEYSRKILFKYYDK
jgi:nucleoside-diphosphate-sugar epimerase